MGIKRKIALAKAFAGVTLWLFTGTVVYRLVGNCLTVDTICENGEPTSQLHCEYTWQQSFYYSVQTGLSIGFGLLQETKDLSRLYSCFHILAGSSFIGAALGLFVSLMCDKAASKSLSEDELIGEVRAKIRSSGYSSIDEKELAATIRKFPRHYRGILDKLEEDDDKIEAEVVAFRALRRRRRKRHVFKLMQRAKSLPEFAHWKCTSEDELFGASWLKEFYDILGHFNLVYCLFIIWSLIGILFCLIEEEWDFVTSLYFTVSALSTAGLQTVTQVKDVGSWHVVFTGIWCLIGVPIFGATLGNFAGLLVDQYLDDAQDKKMQEKITSSEAAAVARLLEGGADQRIDQAQYMILELLRVGAVDKDTIELITKKFKELDKNGSGRVNKNEMFPQLERAVKKTAAEQAGQDGLRKPGIFVRQAVAPASTDLTAPAATDLRNKDLVVL